CSNFWKMSTDVAFWIGEQPGRDLLPLALERVLVCAPVMRPPSFLIFPLALLFEQRRRGSRNARSRNLFLRTERNRELERGQSLMILSFGLDDVPPECFL